MATRARVMQMETPSTTEGNALLVLVALGVAFLLITALLGAAKSNEPLYNESNLLYVALIFYAGAGALYMGFGVTGVAKYVKFASVATAVGFAANTLAVGIAGIWRGVLPSLVFMKCCSALCGRWRRLRW